MKGDDGPYVAMPGYESARGFVEVCTPNTPEAYEQLKEAVLDAYRQKLARMRGQSFAFATEPRQENAVREPIPTAVSARINTLRDGPTLADVSVDIGARSPTAVLSGHNDHRVVMALAVLCAHTGGTITGAEAVRKSFPDFFERMKDIGIETAEI